MSVDELDPLGRSTYGRAKYKYGLVNKRYSSFRVSETMYPEFSGTHAFSIML